MPGPGAYQEPDIFKEARIVKEGIKKEDKPQKEPVRIPGPADYDHFKSSFEAATLPTETDTDAGTHTFRSKVPRNCLHASKKTAAPEDEDD